MKKVKISTLKDAAHFKISSRRNAATYEVVKKEKGKVFYTSLGSDRTFSANKNLKVMPVAKPDDDWSV